MAIETAQELSDEIAIIIQDAMYGFTEILSVMNRALKEIAGHRDIFLPELETYKENFELGGDSPYVSLPSDYQKNLYRCYSEDHLQEIRVYPSLADLLRRFSVQDLSGRVVGVAVKGTKLYYQYIPEDYESTKIYYYKTPTVMADTDDKPDCLPEHLVRPLLVSSACETIFGYKGDQARKSEFALEKEQAFLKLRDWLGEHANPPVQIDNYMDYGIFLP